MKEIWNKVENAFESLSRLLYRNRFKSLFIISILLGGILYQIQHSTVDTSSKAMFREDDTSLIEFNAFLDQFGRADYIVIAIQAPEIFDKNFLIKLKSLHNNLKSNVPNIRQVNSLINARNTRAKDNALIIEDLLQDFPEKEIDLDVVKQRIMNNPYYLNNIVSENGRLTAILMEIRAYKKKTYKAEELFDNFGTDVFISENPDEGPAHLTPKEDSQIVHAVKTVMDQYHSPDFSLTLAGGIVFVDAYNRATANDMRLCLILGSIVVVIFLALLFRRISGVVLPIIVVELAVFSTLGIMAFFDAPVTELSMVIPAFLLAVGVADSVHILTIFYRRLDQGDNKEDAVAFAMGHSGLAIAMTSLTTAAGLFSFSFAELVGIADMGIYAASGVIMAFFCTIFMLPPLISITPIKEKHKQKEVKKSPIMDKVLQCFADFSIAHPKNILFVSFLIFIFSALFITKLEFSHNYMTYFPDSMPIKKALILIDQKLKGISTLEVIVDTKEEDGIHDPDILNRIEKISDSIKNKKITDGIVVGKVSSVIDILKETNQALHENDPKFYSIPKDRETIAQELLLFETGGTENLEKIVDSQFSKARISIKTPNVDAVIYEDFIADVENQFKDMFHDRAEITVTGGVVLIARTVPAALRSMAKSYVVAVFVITIMMIFLVGSIKVGLISMIPNLLPIIFIMGIMGFAGIDLNLTTMMIGSIAIGLVVDDTVHFIYNFKKYFNMTGDTRKAIEETFMGAGRALLITSIILSLGFFVLMLASLHHMIKFGFFTGLIIIFALMADFIVAPALMVLLTRKGKI